MLTVPLVGFALFAGNIHISNAASTYVIEMKDYQYQNLDQLDANGDINVPLGATVAWTNTDPAPHDVAILDGPVLNVSPEVEPGDTWSMTFTEPGTYRYYCEFHPSMVANVVVGNSNSTAPVDRSVQTFAETGKTVRGLFLDYWNSHGGLAQQGFPISEEIQEKSDTDGKIYTVQYFERAVMEYHPKIPPPIMCCLACSAISCTPKNTPMARPPACQRNQPTSVPRNRQDSGRPLPRLLELAWWPVATGLPHL